MTRCPRCQRRLPPKGECAVHGRPSTVLAVPEHEIANVHAPRGWHLGHQIAIGGSSVVLAVTTTAGAPAVLKWGRSRDRELRARFAHEAEVLRAIGKPAAPELIEHGEIDQWPYLIMEHVAGETLAAWMARAQDRGALGEIVAMLVRIVAAVELVHARGFVHRDLKPENLVTASRDTRVLDVGLAVPPGTAPTQIGMIVGTLHYLAPEQIRSGGTIDERTDLYSLGVIGFEMITGQPPFIGERAAIEYQHQLVRPAALGELRAVPRDLEAVIMACLSKQPEGRPQSAAELRALLQNAGAAIETVKGLGPSPAKKQLGNREGVVLVWFEGGDPMSISRAASDVHGIVVRSRPGAILVAFASSHHDAPLSLAMSMCRDVGSDHCRAVVHMTEALLRRSAHGKPTLYGPDLEKVERWIPGIPFVGVVLTEAAASSASEVACDPHLPGFWRMAQRAQTDTSQIAKTPTLVGRDRLVQDISAVIRHGRMLIGLSGARRLGKSRLLRAIAERLRASRCDVVDVRARRRLPGAPFDDSWLTRALGGSNDLAAALAAAGTRGVILMIDDAEELSPAARAALLRDDLAVGRVLASREPLVEVEAGVTRRLAFALQPLSGDDSRKLLRELLQPAQLIPEVLLDRIAIRAAGSPGTLVALASDLVHRGGVRRHAGSDDWYVAVDELDTLMPPPDDAWLAARTMDRLPPELVRVVRAASALGPTFDAAELAAAAAHADIDGALAWLVREGIVEVCDAAYALVDAGLQESLYAALAGDAAVIHERALRYWLSHPSAHGALRVAFHASRAARGA